MDAEEGEDDMSFGESQDKLDSVEQQNKDDLTRIGDSMESDLALLDQAFSGNADYDQVG